jgi:ankyrin repeat protein
MADDGAVEAIHEAAREGDAEEVSRMLDGDPALLSSEWLRHPLLTQAARYGHVGVTRLLLKRGADVNTPNISQDTPLHLAAENGHEEAVSILLGSGADIFRRGAAGWTPLISACSSGNVAVVRLILRAMGGRGLDERSNSGHTALWIACDRKVHVDILWVLLLAGSDHTIANSTGRTPQEIALFGGCPQSAALIQVITSFIVTCDGALHLASAACCAYGV